jgi:hypothetical protein
MKRLLFLLALLALLGTISATVYLTEGFETDFVGSPGAPTGWTQSMNRPVRHATTEKDWMKNTYTTVWAYTGGTLPAAAHGGTGVLWIDDYNYNSTGTPQNSRRMESPALNLVSSTSPYLRFWYFNNQGVGVTLNMRVVVSGNGGSTWDLLTPIVNGFNTANTSWNQISVAIPLEYRTGNFKFGFEITNRYGTNNPFIDDVTVEDYTPTTIVSAASGDWNATATWVGGVIPTADNNVEIALGHTVTVTNATVVSGIIARCQNLTVNGTLAHSTGTANLLHAFGNIVVNGTFNAFNGTSGRAVYVGGSFTVNPGGTATLNTGTTTQSAGSTAISTGASSLVFLNNQPASYTNNGTLTGGRINNILHIDSPRTSGSFIYNSPVTVPFTFGLYLGTVNPNGNLTLGNAATTAAQIIERANGTLTSEPIWGAVTNRSNYYYSPNWVPLTQETIQTGFEIELISGVRTVSGAFTMNTHNNLQVTYPLTLGTATTGTWTLTRGIVITDDTNYVTTSFYHTSTGGVPPSTATPPTNHGSYFAGPLRRTYAASGTTSRVFPLGVGTDFNGAAPNSNVIKSVTLAPGTAASQSPTVSIVGPLSGTPTSPLTMLFETRGFRVNLNGGADFPNTATLTLNGMNYTHGNSDYLAGDLSQLRIAQSRDLTGGTWAERSATSGSGAITTGTTPITRTTATTTGLAIGPIADNGEYFAWASTVPLNPICGISPPADKNFGPVQTGTYQDQIYSIQNSGGSALSVSSVQLSGVDVTQYTLINNNGPSFDIPAGSSATVTVRFQPSVVGGPWPITLVVNHNATPNSNSVNITGSGYNATIESFPTSEGFEVGNTQGSTSIMNWSQALEVGTNLWTVNSTNTTYNRTPRTGSYNVTLYYPGNTWLFRPMLLTGGQSYDVELYARQDGATAANANIGIYYGAAATSAGMTNTIVAQTGLINGNYQLVSGRFTPGSTGTYYLGIRGFINSIPYYVSLDDIKIDLTPSVIPPSGLTVSSVANNYAVLTWTENNSPALTRWDVIYGATGFNPASAGTTMSGVTKPYTLLNLSPSTPYDWYVRADNGLSKAVSPWAGPSSFTTLADPLSFPVLEGFEAGLVKFVNPAGNTVNWTLSTALYSEGAQSTRNIYGATNTNRLQTSSYFDLTTTTAPILTFDHIAKTEGEYDHGYVEVSTNGGAAWTILPASAYQGAGVYRAPIYNTPEGPCFTEDSYVATWLDTDATPTNAWWKSEIFSLADYRAFAQVMVRFRLKSDSSVQRYGWLIDNIAIKEAPAYAFTLTKPANANAVAGLPYNYTVNIQNRGSSSDNFVPSIVGAGVWTYGLYQTDGTTLLAAPITIPAGGNYSFVIKVTPPAVGVVTGDTDIQGFRVTSMEGTRAVENFSLTTTVIVPISAPHTQNFDAVTTPNLPLGWSKIAVHPSNYATVTTTTSLPYNTPNCVSMYNSSVDASNRVMLISPPINGTVSDLFLDFYVKRGSTTQNVIIGSMTDPANAATFTEIATITPTTSWVQRVVSLAGAVAGDKYIAFKHANTTDYTYIYLDNVMFRAPYTGNDILTYSFPQQTGPATIDAVNHTVNIQVAVGTNPEALVASFTLSAGAKAYVENLASELILQTSGVTANDFTDPVMYTIETEGGIQQSWEVAVTVATIQSSENDILTYSFPQQTGPATIDAVRHTVDIEVRYLTNVTALVATFTVSNLASAAIGITPQVSGVTANDFTSPVTYIVTAENGTPQEWLVTVTVGPPALGENIANPIVIPSLPYNSTGDTSTFNHDYGPYGATSGMVNLLNNYALPYSTTILGTSSKDVVYQLNLTEPTLLSIDLRGPGTTWDTALALIVAPGTGPEHVLLINDDYSGVRALQSYVDSGSNYVPAGTYYILVGAYSSASGPYQISVVAHPAPEAPAEVEVAVNTTTNKVIVSWAQDPVMRYNIYSDTNPYGSFATVVATNVNAGLYEITGIPAVNTFYRVTTVFKFADVRMSPADEATLKAMKK